jgi:hypothetical protein
VSWEEAGSTQAAVRGTGLSDRCWEWCVRGSRRGAGRYCRATCAARPGSIPELSRDRAVEADDATAVLDDGDSIGPDARPATQGELERLGWWDHISPLSRETSTGEG